MIQLGPWPFVFLTFIIVKLFPQSFTPLFLLNIWGLSIPHTFSTFTRTDGRNSKNFLKSLGLYLLFFSSLCLASYVVGMVLIYSFYFFWQQYHYSKQNYGIARHGSRDAFPAWLEQGFFLAATFIAIICLFHGGSETFFGYQLKNFFGLSLASTYAVPLNLTLLLFYLALRRKNYGIAISHVALFTLAYSGHLAFAEGWLYLNVFHNTQYLFFMNSHEKKKHFLFYAGLLTLGLLTLSKGSLNGVMINSFPLVLFCMLSLNFTHYVFDGMIWKRKAN